MSLINSFEISPSSTTDPPLERRVKHRQRNNSISVVKDIFGRRGCLVLLVIVIIFLVLLALIIHKILSSVRDIQVDPQVHFHYAMINWCTLQWAFVVKKYLIL
jgi:hypothetical protein